MNFILYIFSIIFSLNGILSAKTKIKYDIYKYYDVTFTLVYAPWEYHSLNQRKNFKILKNTFGDKIFFSTIKYSSENEISEISGLENIPSLFLFYGHYPAILYKGSQNLKYIKQFLSTIINEPYLKINEKDDIQFLYKNFQYSFIYYCSIDDCDIDSFLYNVLAYHAQGYLPNTVGFGLCLNTKLWHELYENIIHTTSFYAFYNSFNMQEKLFNFVSNEPPLFLWLEDNTKKKIELFKEKDISRYNSYNTGNETSIILVMNLTHIHFNSPYYCFHQLYHDTLMETNANKTRINNNTAIPKSLMHNNISGSHQEEASPSFEILKDGLANCLAINLTLDEIRRKFLLHKDPSKSFIIQEQQQQLAWNIFTQCPTIKTNGSNAFDIACRYRNITSPTFHFKPEFLSEFCRGDSLATRNFRSANRNNSTYPVDFNTLLMYNDDLNRVSLTELIAQIAPSSISHYFFEQLISSPTSNNLICRTLRRTYSICTRLLLLSTDLCLGSSITSDDDNFNLGSYGQQDPPSSFRHLLSRGFSHGSFLKPPDNVKFYVLDTEILVDEFDFFMGIRDLKSFVKDTPAVFIIDQKIKAKYYLSNRDFSPLKLAEFFIKYLERSLPRLLLSESIGKYHKQQTVHSSTSSFYPKDLNAITFEDVTLDKTKDVVVMFYTHYCGFCLSVNNLYLLLTREKSRKNNIVFTRINCARNDLNTRHRVKYYPTLKLYPAYNKNDTSTYPSESPWTFEQISLWLDSRVSRNRWNMINAILSAISNLNPYRDSPISMPDTIQPTNLVLLESLYEEISRDLQTSTTTSDSVGEKDEPKFSSIAHGTQKESSRIQILRQLLGLVEYYRRAIQVPINTIDGRVTS